MSFLIIHDGLLADSRALEYNMRSQNSPFFATVSTSFLFGMNMMRQHSLNEIMHVVMETAYKTIIKMFTSGS